MSRDATCRLLPATTTLVMAETERSRAAVPANTASDLSALNWRPFCRNHQRTAAERRASLCIDGRRHDGAVDGDERLRDIVCINRHSSRSRSETPPITKYDAAVADHMRYELIICLKEKLNI